MRVTYSLPPEIKYSTESINLLAEANRHLGNLNGVGELLPNPNLLIVPYMRREAVLSSKIEGTQTSLSDLFYFEAARKEEQKIEAQKTDVLEVVNYVKAMDYGLKRLKELPICLRLTREIHAILMFEIKSAMTLTSKHAVSLSRILAELSSQVQTGAIISCSPASYPLKSGIQNYNWHEALAV